MRFTRDSQPEDRCFYCREFCGIAHPDDGDVIKGHTRIAHWVPALQKHVEVSAHEVCAHRNDETKIPCRRRDP